MNDYVQEIGRAARDKEMTGMACMDYYKKDMNYANQLFGMSAIKQYHIEGCMRVLSNVYKRSRRQNNLITPQAFETVFAKAGDLENTVKTALLNIEKDLNSQFKFPVIITRPRSMFTSAFIVIDKEIKDQFEKSEFYKYVKLLAKGRNNEKERDYQVTDFGDIYSIDLKRLWEEKFSRISFPQFKYTFYQEREKIFEEFAEKIHPRTKIVKYKNVDKKSIGQIIRALNILSIFNLIQYDMYGGENPEIFIRLNDPAKIQAIADGKVKYKNKIVEKAKDKHERDVQILEKFILELKSKEERWNFIEDYFLGKDVLSGEEEAKSE